MKIKQKAKSKIFQTASIMLVVLGLIYAGTWFFLKSILDTDNVCYKDSCFIVEIADSDLERQTGLMNRESMADNRGMLFIFDDFKRHTFWMKDTLIPLDMIRINNQGDIVDIQTAQPCISGICETYTPQGNASYVLEINANIAKEKSIDIGDHLDFKLKK